MGGQIARLQSTHHRLLLDCRSQDRIVQSESFVEAWKIATKVQKVIALTYLNKILPIALKFWVSDVLSIGSLNQLNMLILRQLASSHQIKNYSRMSKLEIIKHIESKGVKFDSQNQLRLAQRSSERDAFNIDFLKDPETPNQY